MKEILTTYNVNEETNALTPAFQLDYRTGGKARIICETNAIGIN